MVILYFLLYLADCQMRHSHFDDIVKQSKMIPGPGSYDPVYERYSSSSFRYLRGGNPMIYRSWRNIFHDQLQKRVPGPSDYVITVDKVKKGYRFSQSRRATNLDGNQRDFSNIQQDFYECHTPAKQEKPIKQTEHESERKLNKSISSIKKNI